MQTTFAYLKESATQRENEIGVISFQIKLPVTGDVRTLFNMKQSQDEMRKGKRK